MFAKKPPPDPKLPCTPPVLRIGSPGRLESISHQAPNDRIAQMMIAQAFEEGAEQITLTPDGKALLVHFLIADEWRDTMRIPAEIASGLTAAFKTLAGLPVWEHRMALQGLIAVQRGAVDYDVHLLIVPTRQGEKITMRIEMAG